MIDNIPRISVRIISYNQEKIICRALESLIPQRDYLYEICISDDCSTDGTFNILLDYQRRYPDLIKPFRNEHNLGIFQNIEAAWNLLSGDIIYSMAGDDEAGEGYFKAVVEFIEKNRIDWRNELFCIYGDYKEIEPDGSTIIYKNSMVHSHDALKLKIRKLLSNRSACFSKKVLDRFEKVSEGRSFHAEFTQDVQLQLFTEKNYYLPIIGNIYFAGRGISVRMNREEKLDSLFIGYQRLIDFLKEHGHPVTNKELAFIEYLKAYRTHHLRKAVINFIKSIDFSLGFKSLQLSRIFFVFLKKREIKKLIITKSNKL